MADNEDAEIQPAAQIKAFLKLAKGNDPIPCALSLDKKTKEPIMYVQKKGKPRKLLADFKKKAKAADIELDMTCIRFGMAGTSEGEEGTLQLTVNKAVPGALTPKFMKYVKKFQFKNVEFLVDGKLEDEPEDEGDEDQDEGGGSIDPILAKRVAELIKKVADAVGSNPPGADAMKTAVTEAQTAVKAADAGGAKQAADTLERLLGAAQQGGAAAGAKAGAAAGGAKNGPGSPVYKTASSTWTATRKRIEADLDKLHKVLQDTYKDHPVGADIEKVFRDKVEPVLGNLDHTLIDKLDEVQKTTEPSAHGKLVKEAVAIIEKYKAYLSSEPLIAQLDQNPFVPISIGKTLTASLNALEKSVV